MVSGIISSSSFSTASISEMMQQVCDKIDTNSDGSIDETEMSSLIKLATSSLVDAIFSKQDAGPEIGQESLISLIESNSGLAKLGQEIKGGDDLSAASGTLQPIEKVFDTFDTNDIGGFSQIWLSGILEALLKGLATASGASSESTSIRA
jgi:Ca2+-binding EF-hand superfamily protein